MDFIFIRDDLYEELLQIPLSEKNEEIQGKSAAKTREELNKLNYVAIRTPTTAYKLAFDLYRAKLLGDY